MRFRLEGEHLESLKELARTRYPDGRIVSGDRVRTGGIAGFLAREHYELVVEVPTPAERRVPQRPTVPTPVGLAALLGAADAAEDTMAGADDPAPGPAPVSTESPRFADLLEAITSRAGALPEPAAPAHPAMSPLRGAGDLVLVLGPQHAARRVARSMVAAAGRADGAGAALLLAGTLSPDPALPLLEERNRATTARASGVEHGRPTVVAYGLGDFGEDVGAHAARVRVLAADQVWLVVDARLKPADTVRWVQGVREHVLVDALAVEAAALTSSPESVRDLGLPVGWVDGTGVAAVAAP